MAESAAYARRTIKGGCALAHIPGGLNSGVVGAVACDDLSSWVGATANGPTRLMINRSGIGPAGSTPEEIEISTVSGNNITIAARGLQSTTDMTHPANSTIEVVSSPRDFDEANFWAAKFGTAVDAADTFVYGDANNSVAGTVVAASRLIGKKASGGLGPVTAAEAKAILAISTADVSGLAVPTTASFYEVHTWTPTGLVAVASGDVNFINGMRVGKKSTETVVLDKVEYQINSGTSVTFSMQVNGVDATGFTSISCTTTPAVTDPANVTLADGDKLVPLVSAVSGSPTNWAVTAWLLHTVTLA